MSERAPTPPPGNSVAVSETLHATAYPTTDLAFGTGQRYDLASGHLSLEVFPEHQLTRITTPTSRLELFNAPTPQVIDGNVVFCRETGHDDTTVHVSPQGTVVFGYVASPTAPEQPATAPEQAQEPPRTTPADNDPLTADPAPPPASGPDGGPHRRPGPDSSPPDTSPAAGPDAAPTCGPRTADTPTKEQQPRLQLTGRLGRDPSFRTSPRGTLVGRFPLAVHTEDGTTTWHAILAFGERAKQLQHRTETGELAKGQEVNLIGYQHTRAQPTREGGTKTVTEIYAVAVTKR